MNGLGPTNPPIATAALGASAEPFNRVQDGVSVSLGDVSATVLYAGVAPMYQGIYQINVLPNSPLSNRLTVSVDGITSNSVTLPVPAGTNVTNLTGSIDGLYPATGPSSAGALTFTALLNAATFQTSFDIVPGAKPFQITARSSTFGTNGLSPTAVISVDPVLNTWQATLTVPAALARAYQFSSPIFDLLTGAPFPGNVVPLSRLDPAAVMAIGSLPLPTTPSSDGFDATFSASGTLPAVGPFRINSATLSELANFGGFVQLSGPFYPSSFTTTYQLFVDGLLVASKTAVISTP